MIALKLTQIGNSLGVVLPEELLDKLKVGKGDTLFVAEAVNGVQLTPSDPEFGRQMTLAQRLAKKRRDVLLVLAAGDLSEDALADWIRAHTA